MLKEAPRLYTTAGEWWGMRLGGYHGIHGMTRIGGVDPRDGLEVYSARRDCTVLKPRAPLWVSRSRKDTQPCKGVTAFIPLVPKLCLGMPLLELCSDLSTISRWIPCIRRQAELARLHSQAELGNERDIIEARCMPGQAFALVRGACGELGWVWGPIACPTWALCQTGMSNLL